jgi:hypothetical protein
MPTPEKPVASRAAMLPEKKNADELEKEPAEVYYKRVYNEYINAKGDLGENVEIISYMKFIEKLVKHENIYKRKYKCKAVRFNVEVKNDKVILSPVKLES